MTRRKRSRRAPTRKHLCDRCGAVVDATALAGIASPTATTARTCRVETACNIRRARPLRLGSKPIVAVLPGGRRTCRFCLSSRLGEHLRWVSFGVFECRAVGACERRMASGAPTGASETEIENAPDRSPDSSLGGS